MPPCAAVAAAPAAAAAASSGSASTTVASRARVDPIILPLPLYVCRAVAGLEASRAGTVLQRFQFLVQRFLDRARPEIVRPQRRDLDLGRQQQLITAQDALGEDHAGTADAGHLRGHLEQV